MKFSSLVSGFVSAAVGGVYGAISGAIGGTLLGLYTGLKLLGSANFGEGGFVILASLAMPFVGGILGGLRGVGEGAAYGFMKREQSDNNGIFQCVRDYVSSRLEQDLDDPLDFLPALTDGSLESKASAQQKTVESASQAAPAPKTPAPSQAAPAPKTPAPSQASPAPKTPAPSQASPAPKTSAPSQASPAPKTSAPFQATSVPKPPESAQTSPASRTAQSKSPPLTQTTMPLSHSNSSKAKVGDFDFNALNKGFESKSSASSSSAVGSINLSNTDKAHSMQVTRWPSTDNQAKFAWESAKMFLEGSGKGGKVEITINPIKPEEAAYLVAALKEQDPSIQISYKNENVFAKNAAKFVDIAAKVTDEFKSANGEGPSLISPPGPEAQADAATATARCG